MSPLKCVTSPSVSPGVGSAPWWFHWILPLHDWHHLSHRTSLNFMLTLHFWDFIPPDFVSKLPVMCSWSAWRLGFKEWTLLPNRSVSNVCPRTGLLVCSSLEITGIGQKELYEQTLCGPWSWMYSKMAKSNDSGQLGKMPWTFSSENTVPTKFTSGGWDYIV